MSIIVCRVDFVRLHRSIPPPCSAALLAALALLWPGSARSVGLIVNEYRAGSWNFSTDRMANDDFIEFVLTSNATSTELAALTFGDTNHQTSQLNSVFRFDQATLDTVLASSGQTSFLAGTIIVVKGAWLGAQNLSYDPQSANIGDADAWSIELVAGQGAQDHTSSLIDGTLNVDRRGEVIWVSTDDPPSNTLDTSGFIAAIGHDNNPGAIADAVVAQFGAGAILDDSFPTARTIQNTGGSTISLAAFTSSTMGAANSVANQTWIEESLRAFAVPEPSRSMLCLVALAGIWLRRRRV